VNKISFLIVNPIRLLRSKKFPHKLNYDKRCIVLMSYLLKSLIVLILFFAVSVPLFAQNTSKWHRLGPFGGPVVNIQKDGHGILWATGYEGIFKSDDDGQTWQLSVQSPDADRLVYAGQLTVHDSIIVAGFNGGTLTSYDYGSHWNTFHFNDNNGAPNDLVIYDDTLYMTADYGVLLKSNHVSSSYPSGILRSVNKGKT